MSTIIPIGPFHPVLEEPEYIQLYVDGETVEKADIDLAKAQVELAEAVAQLRAIERLRKTR